MPKRFRKSGITAPTLDAWEAPAQGTDEVILDRVYAQLDELVRRFQEQRAAILADKHLSPEGQKRRIADLLPAFRSQVQRSREALKVAEMHHGAAEFALKQPDDPKDVAAALRAQEIRAEFRRLPESERLDAVRGAIERGDATLVRAVLGAPAGFELVPESLRGRLGRWTMEATDAARFGAWERVERGLAVVREALDIVAEYPEQESTAETRRAEDFRRRVVVRGGGSEEAGAFAEGEAAEA